jgi:hypothetical protein
LKKQIQILIKIIIKENESENLKFSIHKAISGTIISINIFGLYKRLTPTYNGPLT